MGIGKFLLLFSSIASLLHDGNGCQIDGVSNWLLTQEAEIQDVYRGTFWSRSTTNIEAMSSITVGGSVNYEPYLEILWDESGFFTISTRAGYEMYEENETSEFISFTVNFICSGGSTNSLIYSIRVVDTNNNPPTFRPTDQYEFTITPPLPPGFQITGCVGNDVVVRDIDLTTSRIDFTIEENPYFEISYGGRSSTDPKEFIATIKTKDLIRNLSEDLELTISATDVDATQDPRITTYATIRVKADENFLFPLEPVFTQPFYTATYMNNQVFLENIISLQQGFDDEVTFSLEGEHSDYFEMVADGNAISIEVKSALSNEVLRSGRVILVVTAKREYTSGASATVIVQLLKVLELEFQQTQYKGRIIDNVLESLQLTLMQGYEEDFSVVLQNEFASFFSTSVQGNVITLLMTPLSAQIINENNFVTLQVVASNEYGVATAVVTLDIIKDDNVTPVFEKSIYTGEYDPDTELTVEEIALEQGYDQTVLFSLEGEHREYFSISNIGPVVTLLSSGVPIEIWAQQQLLLSITATKPRTVTATTTISVKLPSARELAFSAPTYSGTLQDNTLALGDIVLSTGYAEDVTFSLEGDYASYFTPSPSQNRVAIILSVPLPDDVILENYFLTLTLSASGLHAVPTSTAILLEIVKQDFTTPVFTQNLYTGSYLGESLIEIGSISLAQGYDSSVTFRLDGEHSRYFQVTNVDNNLNLVLTSAIPPEVIYTEKVLVFNILADKPLTVGTNAAVSIVFPQELTDATLIKFSRNTYTGSLEDNTLSLENIIIETGFDIGTEFYLGGDYASYFQLQNEENVITISIQNSLPDEILENISIIVLEVEASRDRAVSVSSSIVIDIINKEIIPPVFSNSYYKSVYDNGTLADLTITLSEGYDDTVSFELVGETSTWFSITNNANSVYLTLNTVDGNIPDDILDNNDYFLFTIVANKLAATSARAAVFIHLPKDIPEKVSVRFSQTSYLGHIESGELFAPTVTLLGEQEPISFTVTGEYASFFGISQISTTNVEIQLTDGSLPENINEIPFIILDIEAQYPEAISGYTTIILEIVKEPEIVTPVFEQAYYTGEHSALEGLQFQQSMQLIRGFDESVVFTLDGDDAQWFELSNLDENRLTLVVSNNGIAEIRDRSHLVFSIVASKVGSTAGRAAIIISISDFTTTLPINFAQNVYKGSIEDDVLSIESFVLQEGYSPDIKISFNGDHIEYFQLSNQEGVFTLQLLSKLPVDIIEDNNVLVFTLEIQTEDARTHTTIILELIKTEVTPLAFEETYYEGSYSIIGGFAFDTQITLSEGYDETVSFSLEGENSQWFRIVENQYPLILTQISPIPNEVISKNQQLIFVIIAEKPGDIITRSTVIISIIDDTTILEFERNVYLGTIQENDVASNIDTIILREGYSQNVLFSLIGDLNNYFTIREEGASIIVSLQTIIPNELIPSNGIILLELQASTPQAVSTYTTLIFAVVRDDIVSLQFNEIYYSGRYSESEGLEVQNDVILVVGYDESVHFSLEGDDSQYFEAVISENTVSLKVIAENPTEILVNHRPLIFTIQADKHNAISAIATFVIALVNESETTMLRFSQNYYLGEIVNNIIELDSITISEGYNPNVTFSLQGDLESYFSYSTVEATVSIKLETPIPEDLIPNNDIIILELQASASNAISAYTTIVLNVKQEEIIEERLEFNNVYYTGYYSEEEGLVFNDNIVLNEGHDNTVQFILEGDSSQYFEALVSENTVSLRLIMEIPSAVAMNIPHLIFTINAVKLGSTSGRATIVIALLDEDINVLRFDQITYMGSIEKDTIILNPIILSEGYTQDVSFSLIGDLGNYFSLASEGAVVTIVLESSIPQQLIPDNGVIVMELEASATGALSTYATIVLVVIQEEITPGLERLIFNEAYYTGYYTEIDGLMFSDTITLTEGYNADVMFALEGDSSQYFQALVVDNSVTLRLSSSIPPAVLMDNHQLIFTIRADRPGAIFGRATIVISLLDDHNENINLLEFDRITYVGSVEQDTMNLKPITLSKGYSDDVTFSLSGDLINYFTLRSERGTVTITFNGPILEELIPENKIIILELEALAPNTVSANAAIILSIIQEERFLVVEQLLFSYAYYTGSYTELEGLVFEDYMTLEKDYDKDVTFKLEGDHAQYFEVVVVSANSVSLKLVTTIPSAIITNNQQLIFTIVASIPNAISARATVVISLEDEYSETTPVLGFNRISYVGSIERDVANVESIVLSEGYTSSVDFTLNGDLQSYFTITSNEAIIVLSLRSAIPEELIPKNNIIVLEIQASAPDLISAHATIVFKVVQGLLEDMAFSQSYYTGKYSEDDGLTLDSTITLSQGYLENVQFSLEGENSGWFNLINTGNILTLSLRTPIPEDVLSNNRKLIFVVIAQKSESATRATIIISLIKEAVCNNSATFGKVLYEGDVRGSLVQHESISVYSYDGTDIQLYGEYAILFSASISEAVVTVQGAGEVALSADVSFVALELRAGTASAVLLLDVVHTENPGLPTVTFSSSLYTFQAGSSQTAIVGLVQATADNNEAVAYSLLTDDVHLLQSISISDLGELYFASHVNTGVYSFYVTATTVLSEVSATAEVHLTVDSITVCGDQDYILPPLQILDRDEESPHENLIPFNAELFEGCRYTLINRWPEEQSWLYVDENGLHTQAIDREDSSIAFMALSQIQVELILECNDDEPTRLKRSVSPRSITNQLEHLGPYDYGNSDWIITDSIEHNSRRSLVNLIVNDINDNYPIFIGKQDEPIVVGYPVAELEERILPRALAEVEATDADVGENAALVYWSNEEVLAVSPTTGTVHVRDIARLEDGTVLQVHATDRNGQGLTGSLNLLVKLINTNHIAVVTIKNSFIENEKNILSNMATAVGYEIRALRSTVISNPESEESNTKVKREAIISDGASLQLYVYGLLEREPVNVERLTEDINTIVIETVIIASMVSLEDHLENQVICPLPERDTALFVSTIVLAILLFILIVAAAVWFFLTWRKKDNYVEFSDANSLTSQTNLVQPIVVSKPEPQKPRIKIEELKKSEKRLQEMLDAPVDVVSQSPTKASDKPVESKVNIPDLPLVIQSIDKLKDADASDDEDEFGERKKNRRKSVVTFNENVEKIIHVEDPPEDSDFEVYKL